MTLIKHRSEILFLYDAKNCNPNGDPMDANRPRIDEETGKCLVTDVRLKRTIRDYFFDIGYNGQEGGKGDIFIRDEEGKPVTGTLRSDSYNNKEDFLKKFIDVRLFGAVSAPKKRDKGVKTKNKPEPVDEEMEESTMNTKEDALDTNKTFHFTGPVQFGMGKSLNRVKENFIKGTGAFATTEGALQKTFREEYNISYGLIAFHGVINENAAKSSTATEDDITKLMDGIWSGTKNLLTRSKKGHMPRVLLKIDYADGFFIGDLAERLSLIPKAGKSEDGYEDIEDFTINTQKLNEVLRKYQDKIVKVILQTDDRVVFSEPIFTKS